MINASFISMVSGPFGGRSARGTVLPAGQVL